MSATVETTTITARGRTLGQELGDASWLATLRARAARLADELPWPDSRASRPWKYYDASSIDLADYPFTGRQEISATGAYATRFSEAGDAVEALLGAAAPPDIDRFTALHYAALRDGVLVRVPANTEAGVVRLTQRFTGAQLAAPHTIVVTGANSDVTVVEEFVSGEDDIVATPVVELFPGPGSRVRYYAVHRWGERTRAFLHQRLEAKERDSEFQALHLALGGEVVKAHLESALSGRGTASELLGLTYGREAEHTDFYTLQDHIGPDTRSDLLVKSVLTDEARSVYYGLTRVGLGAKNADANQENRNLLLSPLAKADSDPVLEILTNNVIRASHGATAGPVDEEALYYLQSRGLDRGAAEALLVRGFLSEVLMRVPDEALREEFEAALEAKLAG